MKIIVVGGGKVGYYLLKTLLGKGYQVSLIEKDGNICLRTAEEFDCMVINGDGTNIYDLADAGTDTADVVAAVTGSDEENLVVCQMAKRRFGVPRTIARINNPKNESVFRELGVDIAISSTSIIARYIEQEVSKSAIKTLLSFGRGDAVIVEADLQEDSPAVDKTIQQTAQLLPDDSLIVSVIRGDKLIVPHGNTVLDAGDAVIALTTEEQQEKLRRVLIGRKRL